MKVSKPKISQRCSVNVYKNVRVLQQNTLHKATFFFSELKQPHVHLSLQIYNAVLTFSLSSTRALHTIGTLKSADLI